jgi:hypothetical protein
LGLYSKTEGQENEEIVVRIERNLNIKIMKRKRQKKKKKMLFGGYDCDGHTTKIS